MKIFHKKILTASAAVVCVVTVITLCIPKNTVITQIERPDYGQDAKVYELNAKVEDDLYDLEISVPAKKIPMEELQGCFDDAYEIILNNMAGDNESLDSVRSDLVFTEQISKYGMKAEYMLDNYDIVNCFGEVNGQMADEEGSRLTVYVEIQYDGVSQNYEIPITVYPPEYNAEDNIKNAIINYVDNQQQTNQEYIELPDTVDGKAVTYAKAGESRIAAVVFVIFSVGLIWYYKKFIQKRNLAATREKQMKLDYSEIVSKLSLLMGAGMSGAGAFARIAADYTEARDNNKIRKSYAYDEIVAASNRIATGVSECDAYAAFGRACRIHSYVKLGSLMSQNVRKGGEGFTEMLRREASEAFMERKSLARKSGEEAGTKLLLPMIMMLGIVLIIIVIPAFMSF